MGALTNGNRPITLSTLAMATVVAGATWAVSRQLDGLKDEIRSARSEMEKQRLEQNGINAIILHRLGVHEEQIKSWATRDRFVMPK